MRRASVGSKNLTSRSGVLFTGTFFKRSKVDAERSLDIDGTNDIKKSCKIASPKTLQSVKSWTGERSGLSTSH